jgi:hypothetical protein
MPPSEGTSTVVGLGSKSTSPSLARPTHSMSPCTMCEEIRTSVLPLLQDLVGALSFLSPLMIAKMLSSLYAMATSLHLTQTSSSRSVSIRVYPPNPKKNPSQSRLLTPLAHHAQQVCQAQPYLRCLVRPHRHLRRYGTARALMDGTATSPFTHGLNLLALDKAVIGIVWSFRVGKVRIEMAWNGYLLDFWFVRTLGVAKLLRFILNKSYDPSIKPAPLRPNNSTVEAGTHPRDCRAGKGGFHCMSISDTG